MPLADVRFEHDMKLFHIMQRLYSISNFTASGVGDVGMGEYAMLLEISEFDDGVPLRNLEFTFNCLSNPQYAELLLEDKELTRRVRNRADKRSYSCQATTKGRAHVAAIDEALAVAIIGANPNLGENDLGVLIDRLQSLVGHEQDRHSSTIFPADAIVGAYRYHRLAAHACSAIGIPLLQASLLCIMATSETPRNVAYFASHTSIFDSIIEFQLGELMDKKLVRFGGEYEITDRGMQRLEKIFEQFSESFQSDLRRHPEVDAENLRDISHYLLYLFR